MSDEKSTVELSDTLQKIVDQVEKLTVLELADLVKALEEKFGVSASAPVAMAAMPAAGAAAVEEDEKDEFDVVITAVENKLGVIKVVRTIDQSLGLIDAKKLVEALPATILQGVDKEAAEAAKKTLEEASATVELK